jgi:hypothetical protein
MPSHSTLLTQYQCSDVMYAEFTSCILRASDVCVCVCVCARARARVRVYVCACCGCVQGVCGLYMRGVQSQKR